MCRGGDNKDAGQLTIVLLKFQVVHEDGLKDRRWFLADGTTSRGLTRSQLCGYGLKTRHVDRLILAQCGQHFQSIFPLTTFQTLNGPLSMDLATMYLGLLIIGTRTETPSRFLLFESVPSRSFTFLLMFQMRKALSCLEALRQKLRSTHAPIVDIYE